MAAFTAQIQFPRAILGPLFGLGKLHTEINQFLDPRRPLLDDGAHNFFFAQARARFESIADVQFK